MKRIFCMIFGAYFFMCCAEPNDLYISTLAENVLYRFYVIQRLQKDLSVLIPFFTKKIQSNNEQKLLDTIIQDWDDLQQYRHIKSDTFTFNFCSNIIILLECVMEGAQAALEVESVIKLSSSKHEPDIKHTVNSDEIMFEFYLIKRLQNIFNVLKVAQSKNITFDSARAAINSLDDLPNQCIHPRILEALEDVKIGKTLEPVLLLWEEFQQYRYADDSLFLREMLMMLMTTYRDLLHSSKVSQEDQLTIIEEIDHMLELYDQADELSTEEVLDCIDNATDNLIVIINKMEKKESWYQKIWNWISRNKSKVER